MELTWFREMFSGGRASRQTWNHARDNDEIEDTRNKATFHSLRHTFASRLVENGTPLMVVKELMGHKTLAMTERYSHVRNESLQGAVKSMERAMKKWKARLKKVVSLQDKKMEMPKRRYRQN